MTKQKAKALGLIVASALVMLAGFHNCSGSGLQGGFNSLAGGNKIAFGGASGPALPGVPAAAGGTRVNATLAGGGDGYDGMSAVAYASYTRNGQTCPDGSKVASQIQVDPNGQAYLTRDNCAAVQPQHIDPNNYQKVSSFGSDYLVVGPQAYYSVNQPAQKTVNFFCHGYMQVENNSGNNALASLMTGSGGSPYQAVYDSLTLINYMSPQVISVNVTVSGNQAEVDVSRHDPILLSLTTTGANAYKGQSAAGDQMTLNSDSGLFSMTFTDGTSAINNMDLTCEVPYY